MIAAKAGVSLDDISDREIFLRYLVQDYPLEARDILQRRADKEPNPNLKAIVLQILCLYHDPNTSDLFVANLDDKEGIVRAAAVDGIDYLRNENLRPPQPMYGLPAYAVRGPPEINVSQILFPGNDGGFSKNGDRGALPKVSFDPAVRAKLEKMMTDGPSSEEREAAARALVRWPPDKYTLRIAEWGVWLQDQNGDLKLAKEVLEEIPPFVHRIGNQVNNAQDRYLWWMGPVTKPIIHVTVDRPMALDVEVNIREGRPWFAYPKPDDLEISEAVNPTRAGVKPDRIYPEEVSKLTDPTVPPMEGLREGYPWLKPGHRQHFQHPMRASQSPWSLGLRWQSVIALPQRAVWMLTPQTTDARFAWWPNLRKVPSAWLSSRNESERFLYYDGPTLAKPPYIVKRDGKELVWQEIKIDPPQPPQREFMPAPTPLSQGNEGARGKREAIYIQVKEGKARGWRFDVNRSERMPIPPTPPLDPAQTQAALTDMLTTFGLTPEEADGLVTTWSPQFLHADGQRVLLRMTGSDYDGLCPLSVKPPPTQLMRLGLVLSEF